MLPLTSCYLRAGKWYPDPDDETYSEVREWRTYPQNFDNIFAAMGTLFEMSTTEGWVDIMHHGVDAVTAPRPPPCQLHLTCM